MLTHRAGCRRWMTSAKSSSQHQTRTGLSSHAQPDRGPAVCVWTSHHAHPVAVPVARRHRGPLRGQGGPAHTRRPDHQHHRAHESATSVRRTVRDRCPDHGGEPLLPSMDLGPDDATRIGLMNKPPPVARGCGLRPANGRFRDSELSHQRHLQFARQQLQLLARPLGSQAKD